jgi:predicted small metal-binding protein
MDIDELLERLKKQQWDIEERFRQKREELENIIGAIQVITGRTAHSDILGEERAREASIIFLARNTIPINLRTPGAGKVELMKELKDHLKKAKQETAGRDDRIADLEQYPRTMLSSSARATLEGHIQDRDLLTIEREFYSDLLAVLEPRKTQEPSREEQRKRAEHWAKSRKHNG